MNTLTDDARWAEWCSWFGAAHQDISTLFHHRHLWANIVAMLQNNADVAHHSTVNEWLKRGYGQPVAIGIRRQSDHSRRRPTLGCLLKELAKFPQVATRERYLELADDPAVAVPGWVKFAPSNGEHIDPDKVRIDLEDVKATTAAARDWVNRQIAHLSLEPVSVDAWDMG